MTTHAQQNTWRSCQEHLDWQTMSRVVRVQCWTHPMRRTGTVQQWSTRRLYVSPHVRRTIRYPVFQIVQLAPKPASPALSTSPTGAWLWESVSGYSFPSSCGASGAMFDGRWPYIGAAASPFGGLPIGSQVYVPGFGTVIVEDHGGGGLDLFMGSCTAAIDWGRVYEKVEVVRFGW